MEKRVYILQLIEETYDEVKDGIYAVYSTKKQAEDKGKELVKFEKNNYISYHVTPYAFFE